MTKKCAIYTRKSTDKGLDQALTSLDLQRSSAEAFIKSRACHGWTASPTRYDDPAFSGGNMNRPALTRLRHDIQSKLIDIVVVYKLDRLSRSLKDSIELFDFFKASGVEFVSLNESIDTSTPSGRVSLNVIMSIAQYQREDAAERITHKIRETVRAGYYFGGKPIIGYDFTDKMLVPNASERQQALDQFEVYLKEQSLSRAAKKLNQMGYRMKQWVVGRGQNKGKKRGGRAYHKGNLDHVLRNPLYIGKVRLRKDVYDGRHQAIVPVELFETVQRQLDANARARNSRNRDSQDFWLKGLLRCVSCASAMTPAFAYNRHGQVYRYFECSLARKQGLDRCDVRRVPGDEVQGLVLQRLQRLAQCEGLLEAVMKEVQSQVRERLPRINAERERVSDELKGIQQKGGNLALAVAEQGLGGNSFLIQELKEVEKRKEELSARLGELAAEEKIEVQSAPDPSEIARGLDDVCRVFPTLTPEEKKEVAALLFREVLYDKKSSQVVLNFYPLSGLPWLDIANGTGFATSVKWWAV